MNREKREPWWAKVDRELVLFTVGLLLTISLSIVSFLGDGPKDIYPLVVLFAGMMGLPTALRYDINRKRRRDDRSEDWDE